MAKPPHLLSAYYTPPGK